MVNKIDIRQITVNKLHGAYSLKIKRQQHLYDPGTWIGREQVLQALGKGHLGENSQRDLPEEVIKLRLKEEGDGNQPDCDSDLGRG